MFSRRTWARIASAALFTCAPGAALACGGLFCNAAQPVNQAAERVLFARDGDQVEMHVRISYAGPPAEFGWILPTAPDVETTLGSEELFRLMDQRFAPIFRLTQQFDDSCLQAQARSAGGDASAAPSANFDGAEDDGGVQVLSREAVGPFDRTILTADTVQDLRDWLDENAYQIPEGTDEKLAPYVDAGAAFVALKLLPGADAGDVQPLRLHFTAEDPAIPIVPTAVAANPDMGILVHLLGDTRAIPKNYRHLHLNEAAIDWPAGAPNYADVVSQAADESGGKGFTTDFAGPHDGLDGALPSLSEEQLNQVGAAETLGGVTRLGLNLGDADVIRILSGAVTPPEGVPADQFVQCPQCWADGADNTPVDGAALAARFRTEINAPRDLLRPVLEANPYLTRLFTTMSAGEMDQDPVFSFNPDLAPVPQTRNATQHNFCDENGSTIRRVIELSNGQSFPLEDGAGADVIQRDRGESVRGADVPAAAVVEQMAESGQPMVISDRRQELAARYNADLSGGAGGVGGSDSGCGCDVGGDADPAPAGLLLGMLALLGLGRRRFIAQDDNANHNIEEVG